MARRSQRPISGQVVVLTGATSGAGRATALAFARRGARVVVVARHPGDVRTVVAECESEGADALGIPADVTRAEDIDRIAAGAIDRFGRIDGWVNAAAVLIAGRLEATPVDELEQLCDTNVFGTLVASRRALTVFDAQGHGTLVNVSSVLGLMPNLMVPAYTMSKFAVRGLSLSLRQAVAGRRNIHVCVVMPGPIDTPMFDRAANHTGHQLRAIPPACAPDRVAAAIVRAFERPRRQKVVGVTGRAIVAVHHVLPRLTEFGVAQVSARLLQRRAPAGATSGSLFGADGAGRMQGGWRLGRWRRRLGDAVGRRSAAASSSARGPQESRSSSARAS